MTEPVPVRGEISTVLADHLLSERGVPVAAHLLLFALVAVLVWGAVPGNVLLPWGGAVALIVCARAVLWEGARRRRMAPHAVALMARVTMLALGLAWGVGTAAAAPYLSAATLTIVLLGLTGLLAGGMATLLADAWVFPIYAAAMLAPVFLAVGLAMPGRPADLALVLTGVFLAFMIRLHRRAHDMLVKRVQAESDLRNREGQLADAQLLAHVGSWEWDMRANRVTWSEELYRIYGVPLGTPAGYEEFLARVHPDDRARVKGMVEQQLADHKSLDYEWRVQRPNGEVRYMQSRQVVVTDGGGQALRMLGTAHDVTESREAEESQRSLFRELQKSVAEIKVLHGILPICANCKRIRTEQGSWEQIESYVRDHSNAEFSHGICPECARRVWQEGGTVVG
jgi:PAS domain S-box-containing protein